MRTITLEELLEAGCHFGHQVTRQNPKARDYIFEARDGIHIIDLEKTKEGLEEAGAFIKDVAKRGGTLLVLGTKRQAESVLKEQMERLQKAEVEGVYFVTKRWIGGTLTNFPEVSKNFRKLKDLTRKLHDASARANYTKKEILDWEKERQKLLSFYSGIEDMQALPDALFVIDTHLEDLAVQEAVKTGIKVAGITDTNADPTIVDYPIPANDDAVGSLQLIVDYIMEAWVEGRKQKKEVTTEEPETSEKKVVEKEKKSSETSPAKSKEVASSAKKKEEKKKEEKK
jgi:small subunit ribosomal protein S2